MTVGSDKSSKKKPQEHLEEKINPPPDGGYGWVILAGSFVIFPHYLLTNSE